MPSPTSSFDTLKLCSVDPDYLAFKILSKLSFSFAFFGMSVEERSKTEPCRVALAGLELAVWSRMVNSGPAECWDYRCVSPHLDCVVLDSGLRALGAPGKKPTIKLVSSFLSPFENLCILRQSLLVRLTMTLL